MKADYAKYRTEELGPGAISRMIWGFATLGVRHETMMSIVAAEVVKKIQGFNHQELLLKHPKAIFELE